MPLWRMKEDHVNQHDIRFRLKIPLLATVIHYKKASYLGHTMRRGNDWLPKIALTGRFLPSFVSDGTNQEEYFWDPKNTPGQPERIGLGSVVTDVYIRMAGQRRRNPGHCPPMAARSETQKAILYSHQRTLYSRDYLRL